MLRHRLLQGGEQRFSDRHAESGAGVPARPGTISTVVARGMSRVHEADLITYFRSLGIAPATVTAVRRRARRDRRRCEQHVPAPGTRSADRCSRRRREHPCPVGPRGVGTPTEQMRDCRWVGVDVSHDHSADHTKDAGIQVGCSWSRPVARGRVRVDRGPQQTERSTQRLGEQRGPQRRHGARPAEHQFLAVGSADTSDRAGGPGSALPRTFPVRSTGRRPGPVRTTAWSSTRNTRCPRPCGGVACTRTFRPRRGPARSSGSVRKWGQGIRRDSTKAAPDPMTAAMVPAISQGRDSSCCLIS